MFTFDVDDVQASPERFRVTISPIQAMTFQLGDDSGGRLEAAAANLENILGRATAEDNYDDYAGEVASPALHPFVESVHLAYSGHFPLELSPDDVWLCIAQGFGTHVNANAEELRERFVQHQGRKLLRVHRDQFVKGSPDNDWPGVFAEFSDKIGDHIGKQRDLVVADFSTTGKIEKAVSEVVLMSAMQSYFEYRVCTLCGIPRITLHGTPDDWISVRTRAAVLSEYGLGWWIESLLPILDEFVAASQGKPNRDFWRSIYKFEGGSGGSRVSGWIPAFFPYVTREMVSADFNGPSEIVTMRNDEWFKRWKRDPEYAPLLMDSFPRGFAMAPFIWEYLGTEIPMQLLAGFLGVVQHPETGAIRPVMGWAIRETP